LDTLRQRDALTHCEAPADAGGAGLVSIDSLAIIPVHNERRGLAKVLEALREAPVTAAYVVSNGSTDGTPLVAQTYGAMVKTFPDLLGHDVGRAVGCLTQAAEKYLFLDGDIAMPPEDLKPFVFALDEVDVALNDIDPLLKSHRELDGVSIVKRFLNLALDRPDLGTASLTAVPHAMRRTVPEHIGAASLAVPPLALAKAVLAGFTVKAVHAVDVIGKNRFRKELHSQKYGRPLERLILGDHLEALAYLQSTHGPRAFFPDTLRRRDLAHTWHAEATIKFPSKVHHGHRHHHRHRRGPTQAKGAQPRSTKQPREAQRRPRKALLLRPQTKRVQRRAR
jgi:glycosyltransferase involved in cell wall biosynthesis